MKAAKKKAKVKAKGVPKPKEVIVRWHLMDPSDKDITDEHFTTKSAASRYAKDARYYTEPVRVTIERF